MRRRKRRIPWVGNFHSVGWCFSKNSPILKGCYDNILALTISLGNSQSLDIVSFIHITERTGDTTLRAWQVTVACLLQLTEYHSCLSVGLLCQSSLTDSTKIIRGLSAVQDTKIRELIHLCPQEFIILLIPSLVLPLCYLYLFSFYLWTLLSALKWKVKLSVWWGYSKNCYCHGSMNISTLLIVSFTHSFICPLSKCLLNVFCVPRTVQNTGDRWRAKIHAFMESIIYCERNTCMKVTPQWAHAPEVNTMKGEIWEDWKEAWRITSQMGLESFPGKGNTTQQASHSDLKATLKCWAWGEARVGCGWGGRFRKGLCRQGQGFSL